MSDQPTQIPNTPEKQEQQLPESGLLKADIYKSAILGEINVSELYRQNPKVDFTNWIDAYSSKAVQEEVMRVLSDHAKRHGGDETKVVAQVDKLFVNIMGTDKEASELAFDDLRGLVKRLNEYGKKYEDTKEEIDKFRDDVLFDGLRTFAHREIVEGFQTKPLATFAKVAIAGVLIHQLWTKIIKPKGWDKKVILGGLVAGGLYTLNGLWPHLNKKEKTLFEVTFGRTKVKSEAFRWFFQKAGVKNREKIGAIFAISETPIDKLTELYILGKGNEQIDLSQLKDYADDPKTADQLDDMDTYRSRHALFQATKELLELSGEASMTDLAAKYRGQTLRSVIIHLYSEKMAGGSLDDFEGRIREELGIEEPSKVVPPSSKDIKLTPELLTDRQRLADIYIRNAETHINKQFDALIRLAELISLNPTDVPSVFKVKVSQIAGFLGTNSQEELTKNAVFLLKNRLEEKKRTSIDEFERDFKKDLNITSTTSMSEADVKKILEAADRKIAHETNELGRLQDILIGYGKGVSIDDYIGFVGDVELSAENIPIVDESIDTDIDNKRNELRTVVMALSNKSLQDNARTNMVIRCDQLRQELSELEKNPAYSARQKEYENYLYSTVADLLIVEHLSRDDIEGKFYPYLDEDNPTPRWKEIIKHK